MSEDKYSFVKESLNSKAIPSPKLLIKDHIEINDYKNYQTWLVVPATNFTTTFSKLGYIGIKKNSKKTIVQASHLKTQIESLGIRRDKHMIFSLDIEAFYPSVTYGLVKRVIDFSPDLWGGEREGKDQRVPQNDCIWDGQHFVDFSGQVLRV
jgi:hypothetical protein